MSFNFLKIDDFLMKTPPSLLSVFLAAIAFLSSPMYGADASKGSDSKPPLRWAAAVDSNAPFAFYDKNNRLTGFEYEIICAIARHMEREPKFVQNSWDGLIPGLGRDLYDCVICGIEITSEKAQEVLFSDPYYITFEQLVVAKGTPPITSLAELSGRKIGTLEQTAAIKMLQETPNVVVKSYPEELNAYRDIGTRLYGVLLDYPIAKYYAGPNPELEFTGPPFGKISYGIAVSRSHPELIQQINVALAEVIASGELRDILSRWGLWTPTMAADLKQTAEPSLPDTEYKAFAAEFVKEGGVIARLKSYLVYWPVILQGAVLTLEISILSMVLAIALGFSLALMRVYGPFPISQIATLYIELVRGTPLLIQLLIIFNGLPNIGIRLDPFMAGMLGLGLNYAAYEAENYRAGLLAIPKGQMEAARALGMTHRQGLRFVVIPQAFRLVLPPVTNDFISLLKDSSLVSAVTLIDLTGAYTRIATQTFDYFGTGLLIAAIYLLIGLPFVRLAGWLESKLSTDKRTPDQKPSFWLGLGA
jgi:polar amino acid transport system substrate-binding protein